MESEGYFDQKSGVLTSFWVEISVGDRQSNINPQPAEQAFGELRSLEGWGFMDS